MHHGIVTTPPLVSNIHDNIIELKSRKYTEQ
jgi:hypothetical protein